MVTYNHVCFNNTCANIVVLAHAFCILHFIRISWGVGSMILIHGGSVSLTPTVDMADIRWQHPDAFDF